MRSFAIFGALAVFAAAPLSAQGKFRTGDINPARPSTATGVGGVLGRVIGTDTLSRNGERKSDHIPPGQRPPAGMCRIWIDGVPPGQQPAPTDCQTAVATKPANARVIWGDQTAFPGKGKGKFNKQGKQKVRGGDARDDDHKVRGGDDRDDRDDDRKVRGRDDRDDRDDDLDEGRGRSPKSVGKKGRKG